MKRKLQMIIGVSAVSVLTFSALAEHTNNLKTGRLDSTHGRAAYGQRADRLNGAAKASEVIGMTVKNYQDEKLGKVDDLAVDLESGRIVQVIVSTGGFIGVGDTLTAVPPRALHHDVAQKVLHLDATKEKLKVAPRFDTAKWDEGTQSNRVIEVYSYYGQPPYFIADGDGFGATSEDLKLVQSLPRNLDGTINTDSPRTVEKVRNVEAVRKVAESYNVRSTRNADGTFTREYIPASASWGRIDKASKIMGMPVKNRQDEKLGDVDNVLVDLSSGRIVAVVISSGGFLGMRDELSAIPPSALQFTPARDALQLDTTKEMLSSAPHFKANQWPDFNQPAYAGKVYRAYNVEPYFTSDVANDRDSTRRNVRDRDERNPNTTGADNNPRNIRDRDERNPNTSEPDNTARNIRERDDQTLTPLDQGNSKADVSTTAQIRKEIVADKAMSVNAQNVKIITKDGRVTLRGPVNTAEEKRRIGEIADRIAAAGNVDNQIEVKSTSSNK